MNRRSPDWSLYLVTDRPLCGGRPIEDVVAAAIRGGVTVVQVREKELSTRDFLDVASRIRAITRAAGVPLLINDRVDIALAVGADGVHVGQSDMPPHDARRLMGPDALIGLSVESRDDIAAAESTDVDYLGVSPVFCTPTKAELTRAWGLDGLRAARAQTRRPLVAIGGIHAGNAADVIAAGADGIAVVSAICAAFDPEVAARALRAQILAGRERVA